VNILVCMKQVPDTEASIKIAVNQKSIEESGIKFIINPYDEFAVEEALRIKEAAGTGKVKAICMGPERAKEALRTAVAMGVDEVLLIKLNETLSDGVQTAQTLAGVIKNENYDLILMGKETIDDGNMEVGPMIAEMLQIPCITVAVKVSIQDKVVTAEREGEDGIQVLAAQMPCMVTCQKGLNEPRYPSIRGVMMAKKKEIMEQTATAVDSLVTLAGYSYPVSRTGGRVVGEGAGVVPELVKLLREEAKVI
jgi:electron transfer flavoprotein beta subunit